MQQLGAFCLLLSQDTDQLSVEDQQQHERHEEHDDKVEEVAVDDAIDGIAGQWRGLGHEDRRRGRC